MPVRCFPFAPLPPGSMTTLRSLPLEGNPLKTIRRELVAGGWWDRGGRGSK